jgi:hypothetical protein
MSLLPNKTIRLEYSLLGVGAAILQGMRDSETMTSLWEKTRKKETVNTYEKFVSGLVFLYSINAIDFDDGLLVKNEN